MLKQDYKSEQQNYKMAVDERRCSTFLNSKAPTQTSAINVYEEKSPVSMKNSPPFKTIINFTHQHRHACFST
jgi:hypothetical protein